MRILVVALWFAMVASALAAQSSAGNAEKGKKIFASYGCYQCHGYMAQGGVGPRLVARPNGFEGFSKYVRQPTGEMPPYTAKVVTDEELRDIYGFLQSIPQPPAVKSIPLLNN
jgi:ubiquinol-cytochrome c reductase cytochrome c subunit